MKALPLLVAMVSLSSPHHYAMPSAALPVIALGQLEEEDTDARSHQSVAVSAARSYFAQKMSIGISPSYRVTVTITPNETKPVDGWMGRYRTSGTASVKVRNGPEEESGASYYNYEFEVLTERKDSGSIEVVDITTK